MSKEELIFNKVIAYKLSKMEYCDGHFSNACVMWAFNVRKCIRIECQFFGNFCKHNKWMILCETSVYFQKIIQQQLLIKKI